MSEEREKLEATNVRPEDRASIVTIAKEFHAHPLAVVLDVGVDACLRHNADRPERVNQLLLAFLSEK